MLIRGAELPGLGTVDLLTRDGRIAAIGPGLAGPPGEPSLQARGGALLPGLHDHHIHLLALAAALDSVRCGPPQIRNTKELERALRSARPHAADGWLRGVGYHESVAGELDRAALDALLPDTPVRIQHRSGALWMLSSAALAELGLDGPVASPASPASPAARRGIERDSQGRATGRLFRIDSWLREQLPEREIPDLARPGRLLTRCGVTGVTDATPGNGASELALFAEAIAAGALRQQLILMGAEDLPTSPAEPQLACGARKLVLSEFEPPPFEELASWIHRAHSGERPVAIHCVTRLELALAVAAFEEVGTIRGDRIEHASVAPPDAVECIARLGLTVVTQPNFVYERGDTYRTDVTSLDQPWLYRCSGFLDAGVALGAGTDAPFGDPDPWQAMRAAVDRRSCAGYLMGESESLSPERALALFTTPGEDPGGAPRRIEPGAPADLCLLDRPWSRARDTLECGCVRAVLQRGELVFDREA